MRRLAGAAGVCLVAVLAAVACGTVDVPVQQPPGLHVAGTPDATFGPGGPDPQTSGTPVALGTLAPEAEIAGLRLTGPAPGSGAAAATPGPGRVALADLRGPRGTVVALWATWCVPCQKELPELQAIEPSLGAQGVRLVLVDEGESASTVSGWLHDRGVRLASWIDEDGSVLGAFAFPATPSTAVLGPGGAVLYRILGDADVGPLRADLAAMGISAQ